MKEDRYRVRSLPCVSRRLVAIRLRWGWRSFAGTNYEVAAAAPCLRVGAQEKNAAVASRGMFRGWLKSDASLESNVETKRASHFAVVVPGSAGAREGFGASACLFPVDQLGASQAYEERSPISTLTSMAVAEAAVAAMAGPGAVVSSRTRSTTQHGRAVDSTMPGRRMTVDRPSSSPATISSDTTPLDKTVFVMTDLQGRADPQ